MHSGIQVRQVAQAARHESPARWLSTGLPLAAVAFLLSATGCSSSDRGSDAAAGSGGTAGSVGGAAGQGGNTAFAGNGSGGSAAGAAGVGGAAAGGAAGDGTGGVPAAGSGGLSSGGGGAGGGAGAGGAANCPWPAQKGAIATLNYDDGLDTQLRDVIPALDARGLKASFFIANYQGEDHNWALPNLTDPLNARHLAWQAAVQNGHELSAHTVFHPCDAGHLASYTLQQMADELDDNIARLERLGATAPFTFGYPCLAEQGIGQPTTDFGPLVEERFIASRKSPDIIADPATVDLYVVPNVEPMGKSAQDLTGLVDQAIAQGGWVQFGYHGFGPEVTSCPQGNDYDPQSCALNHNVSDAGAHEALLDYLVEKQDQIWTATFKEAVLCLQAQRQ